MHQIVLVFALNTCKWSERKHVFIYGESAQYKYYIKQTYLAEVPNEYFLWIMFIENLRHPLL
jgi:hypothetical protein